MNLNVRWLIEEGCMVRGTIDVHAALAALVDDEDAEVKFGSIEMGSRDRYETDDPNPPEPADVACLADDLHELYASARPGYYRWIPGSVADREDGGVTFWLRHETSPGRGVFQGVYFL